MSLPKGHTSLPVSSEELDAFVELIVRQFSLPPGDDTYESIATLIMHMPQSAASAPLSFFADSVNKSRANAAAYEKLREFAAKRAQASAPASNQVDTQPQVSTNEQSVQDPKLQKATKGME